MPEYGTGFGGHVWNSEERAPYHSLLGTAAAVGNVAAGSYVGFKIATSDVYGRRPIDSLYQAARFTGNLSPFSVLNTFSTPDFMFPFTSPHAQGLAETAGRKTWTSDFLKKRSTYDYLQKITGLDRTGLEARGITEGMENLGDSLATALVFEPGLNAGQGSLYSIVDGNRKLLSDSIMLMSMEGEIDPFTQISNKIGRATRGIFQALDMYSNERFKDDQVFTRQKLLDPVTGTYGTERSQYLPVPSMAGSWDSFEDIGRRTSFIRGWGAFRAARFNDLLEGTSTAILGARLGGKVNSVLGIDSGVVRYGPASHMFGRYGAAVAGIAGVGMGISQLDWMRREYGVAGQLGASGVMSAGLSLAAGKFGATARTQAIIGTSAFVGQMLIPGFDQGVVQGAATMAVKGLEIRGASVNPFNYYRRTLEGFAPGITGWETGALLAIGAGVAATTALPVIGKANQFLLNNMGPDKLNSIVEGIGFNSLTMDPKFISHNGMLAAKDVPRTVREIFTDELLGGNVVGHSDYMGIGTLVNYFKDLSFDNMYDKLSHANQTWRKAKEIGREERANNPFTKALAARLEEISGKYPDKNLPSRLMMEAEGFAAQAYFGFFGGDMTATKGLIDQAENLGFSKLAIGNRGRFASVAGAAFLMHGLLTGGFLGSMETTEELIDIYERGKPIEVKKSRWWEGGGTPYEGSTTSYFRPHQYYLMMNRVREAGQYGAYADSSPISKFMLKNFTYKLERENYHTRPYPITSAAFQDIPIIGGLLSSTIGQFIKPAKLMHASEWQRYNAATNDVEVASVYRGSMMEPSYVLGAVGRGKPVSEFTAGHQAMMALEQFRELEGMTGWGAGIMQQMITGESSARGLLFDKPLLASASQITDPTVMFAEANLGGLMFTNEIVRRILPSYKTKLERENPIRNQMPSWMPDKFRYGDPYRQVEFGEARLPGAGYEKLHPEISGMNPEDYPDVFKYDILASIAPLSYKTKEIQRKLYQRRMENKTTAYENRLIDRIDAQLEAQVRQQDFDRVDPNAIELPGSGLTQFAWFESQRLLRKAAAPVEYLIPMGFRPIQKLTGQNRDAIEAYEYERMYGTPLAFWDKPWRDWFRPAMNSAANLMGYEGKPNHRYVADKLNAQYDVLEFIKNMKLAEQAEANGDGRAKRRYLENASKTRIGANPAGNPMSIYWSLPAADRKFFDAFSSETSFSKRQRILEMVPEDQVHLYKALWSRLDSGDPSLWTQQNNNIDPQTMASLYYGLTNSGIGMPQEDWIGWHADVDMDDIRVRQVEEMGGELADFGLWEKQLKKSMGQDFLDGSTLISHELPNASSAMQANVMLRKNFGTIQNRGMLSVLPTGIRSNVADIAYDDYRDLEIQYNMRERY
jgi:hypothetical protein